MTHGHMGLPSLCSLNWKWKERTDLKISRKRAGESLVEPNMGARLSCKTHESFRRSLQIYKEHITAPNLPQPAPDTHLNDLQKQGFQPTMKEAPTSPMTSNFGTKSVLTSSPPTLKQTLQPLGAASTRSLTLISWSTKETKLNFLRWPYTPRSVHCHSSLHLQRRQIMRRHDHPWVLQHSSKGLWKGKIQRLTWPYPHTPNLASELVGLITRKDIVTSKHTSQRLKTRFQGCFPPTSRKNGIPPWPWPHTSSILEWTPKT